MAQHKEDAGKAQTEVERLLEILREMENEKNDKEKKIHELERWEMRSTRCIDTECWWKDGEFEMTIYKTEFLKHFCISLFPFLFLKISRKQLRLS